MLIKDAGRPAYQQQQILDALNAGIQEAKDYLVNSKEAAIGFFWNGPKNMVIGVFKSTNPIEQIKQIHAQWRYILLRSQKVGIVAADRELRQKKLSALKDAWSRSMNSSRGNGELVFNITLIAVTVGDGLVGAVDRSLASLDGVSINALGGESIIAPVESESALLQGHLIDAIAKYDAEYLTDAQAEALLNNPGLEAAFRGDRIDSFIKEAVGKDPNLQHLELTPRFKFGPDIFDPATQRWWDVTTPGQWEAHTEKYWLFGDGNPLFTTK